LPSVPWRHSAKNCKIIFAECRLGNTRQSSLCRVPPIWHSAKRILKLKKSLSSARSRALGKALIHSAGKDFIFLTLSLVVAMPSPHRRRAAVPTPSLLRRRAAPRRRSSTQAQARAASSQPRPSRAPRRAPVAPPPCPRRAPATPSPAVPSPARRLARDPSSHLCPVVSLATRRLARDQTSKVIACFRFVLIYMK
jgi:hypothetical protein